MASSMAAAVQADAIQVAESSTSFLAEGIEMFSVMQSELVMFALAALVYILVTSGALGKKQPKRCNLKVDDLAGDARGTKQVQRPAGANRRRSDSSVSRGLCTGGAEEVKTAKSIRAFGKEGNLEAAVTTFEGMKQDGCTPSLLSYNSVMDACVECDEVQKACEYLAEAKDLSIADVVSFNTILKGRLSAGDFPTAWSILTEMKSNNIAPSHVTFHSLLHANVQRSDRFDAWRCITLMQETGLKPTAVTCSILVKLVASGQHQADVPRVLALVDQLNEPVDDVLLSSIVEACLQAKRLDLLSQKLNMCRQRGGFPQLSAPTYGSMIKAYGQARQPQQVWALWQEMRRCDVQPTMITLGCMVEALVMNGLVDGAWELVQKLWDEESQRILLNTVIYSTILKGFAMMKAMDKVLALYDEMKSRDVECNAITYNTMLNALIRCGELQRVPQLLEDMRDASPPIEPDMITYSTIMKGYCSSGDLDKGLLLLKQMEEGGKFLPDEVMFNSLLDGCAKQQRLDDAMWLLEKMRKEHVAPSNYTLSIMIKLLGRTKRLNQAFAMVTELSEEFGFRPNIFVYTCLIQACFHNRHLGKALALHDQVVKDGCVFDQKAYAALVQGCLRAGSTEKAADVVRCAFGLPGSSMHVVKGTDAPGVDSNCLQELLDRLNTGGNLAHVSMAKQLASDIDMKKKNGSVGRSAALPRHTPAPWRRTT